MSGIDFLSSGDPEKDRRERARITSSDRLRAEGMCPNGCGPMRVVSAWDMECPACGFGYFRATPHGLTHTDGQAEAE